MTTNSAKPWKMLLPLGAVLLIAVLWSTYWFVASSYVRRTLNAERTRLAGLDVTFTCSDESWGGFPFRFEWYCGSFSLENGPSNVQGAGLRAVTLAYNPTHVLIFVDGPTTATATRASFAARIAGQIVASLEGLAGSEPQFSIDIPAIDAGAFGRSSRILLHGRLKEGKAELAAEAQAVSISDPHLSHANAADISLRASTPRDPLSLGRLPRDLLEGRARITIDQLGLKHGTVSASGNGTLGLDEQRRIAGTFTVETNDIDGLLKVLAATFDIKESDRATIRNMLAGPGTPVPAKATFTARDGALYWGVIPIGLLEPVY